MAFAKGELCMILLVVGGLVMQDGPVMGEQFMMLLAVGVLQSGDLGCWCWTWMAI